MSRSLMELSPQEWAARYRVDDGEQQPISLVERHFGLETQRKRHGLQLMRPLLAALGNPQDRYPVVHITGSKGKGSTAAMIAAILQAYGLRVGLYVSPSLTCFEERIQVNSGWISPAATAQYVRQIQAALQRFRLPAPKFFEAATAVAFLHFAAAQVDVAVVEVGIGGRRDATNVVRSDVAVITSIELEHTAILGASVGAIAAEKAGIIKHESVVISGVDGGEAAEVVAEAAQETNAQLYRLGEHFTVDLCRLRPTHQRLTIELGRPPFRLGRLEDVPLNLSGCYQARNAALAVAACECLLRRRRWPLEGLAGAVRDGLERLYWPGRLELTELDGCRLLLDVAHTPGSIEQLADYLERFFPRHRTWLVLGILRDKPVDAIAELLAPRVEAAWVAPVKWFRTADPATVASAFEARGLPVHVAPSIRLALQRAVEQAEPGDLVVVTGSVFAVGEAKRAFGL